MDLPEIFSALSDDAKAVGAGWFGMMEPGRCSGLHFSMQTYRPTTRSQAALDELEKAGLVDRHPGAGGAISYVPLHSMRPLLAWMWERQDDPALNFQMVERINGEPPEGPAGYMTLAAD